MTSSSSFRVLPSLTVTTPFLPTRAIALAISSPTSLSPLAEIVATWGVIVSGDWATWGMIVMKGFISSDSFSELH